MVNKHVYVGLDVGERRIGVAVGDSIGRIARPLQTIVNQSDTLDTIRKIAQDHDATDVVLGLPRNQSGDATDQTSQVKLFATQLATNVDLPQHWQDESLTSVLAEQRLAQRKKPYRREDVDAEAATIILQDFLDGLS